MSTCLRHGWKNFTYAKDLCFTQHFLMIGSVGKKKKKFLIHLYLMLPLRLLLFEFFSTFGSKKLDRWPSQVVEKFNKYIQPFQMFGWTDGQKCCMSIAPSVHNKNSCLFCFISNWENLSTSFLCDELCGQILLTVLLFISSTTYIKVKVMFTCNY